MEVKRRITVEEQEDRIKQIELEEAIVDSISTGLPITIVVKALANVLKSFVSYL